MDMEAHRLLMHGRTRLQTFGNVPDALRAYNAPGRSAANGATPETAGYVGRIEATRRTLLSRYRRSANERHGRAIASAARERGCAARGKLRPPTPRQNPPASHQRQQAKRLASPPLCHAGIPSAAKPLVGMRDRERGVALTRGGSVLR